MRAAVSGGKRAEVAAVRTACGIFVACSVLRLILILGIERLVLMGVHRFLLLGLSGGFGVQSARIIRSLRCEIHLKIGLSV